jgi:hypothetical protein
MLARGIAERFDVQVGAGAFQSPKRDVLRLGQRFDFAHQRRTIRENGPQKISRAIQLRAAGTHYPVMRFRPERVL